MITKEQFQQLICDTFEEKFGSRNFKHASQWKEVWQYSVDEAYKEWKAANNPTESEIYQIGLWYAEAMELDENVRRCSHCGKPIYEGYYLDGEYACSDECRLALYDDNEEQIKEDFEYVGSGLHEYYYTNWEYNYFRV